MKYFLIGFLFFYCICPSWAQKRNFLSVDGQKKLLQLYQSPDITTSYFSSNTCYSSIEEEYLRLYDLFLAYQSSERKLFAESFHTGINQFSKMHSDDDRFPVMYSTLLIQQSLLYWNNEDFTNGIRSFYKAHRKMVNIRDSNYPIQYNKLKGIINVFLNQIPEQYRFWTSLIGLNGNIDIGFKLLAENIQLCSQTTGEYIEALVLYNYCQLKFGEVQDSNVRQQLQLANSQNSPLLSFVVTSLAIKNKLGNEGLAYINELSETTLNQFPLLHYMKGRLLLNSLDSACLNQFHKFKSTYSGDSFKTDALLREAWWYHINALHTKRDSIKQLITQEAKLPTSNDKQAKAEITTLNTLPVSLLKARLLYDGGYFGNAQLHLNQTNMSRLNEYYRAEIFYRKAKIQQQLHNYKDAMSNFNQVIALTQNDDRYIGPYSALETAKIYLKVYNDTTSCQQYLEQAHKLNTGAYKKTINYKVNNILNN